VPQPGGRLEWTLHAVTIIDTIEREPKALRPVQPKNAVRATDSVWTRGDDRSRALHLTTFECASREDARAQFQWLLKNTTDPAQLAIAKRELAGL